MLNLTDERRRELHDRGALTVDSDGDEVLVGLTLSESHFFLIMEEDPLELHATGELALYYQLKHKHLCTRSAAIMDRVADWDAGHS
jgi:hypothetical protein